MSKPPCSTTAGRPLTELLDTYKQFLQQPLSDPIKVADGVWVSKVSNLTLKQYADACKEYCSLHHKKDCTKCTNLTKAADMILQNGFCSLSSLFCTAFPGISYTPKQARCRLVQLPVALIRVGEPSSGCSDIKVMEHIPGLDYRKWKKLMEMYFQKSSSTRPSMSKDSFRQLLSFAQGRRERETLTYAVYKASGISATAARKHYGIENIVQRSHVIEESIMEAQTIRDCIDSLSATEEQAMLLSLGIPPDDPSSEDESCSDTESEECIEPCPLPQLPSKDVVLATLSESRWNWFEFSEQMEQCNIQSADDGTFADMLEKIYDKVISSDDLNPDTKKLLKQSHDAYVCDRNRLLRDVREADSLNGMIVADSIDVNPEEYVGVRELAGERVKSLVIKRRKAIRRHNRYLKAKNVAERNFLKRKSSKRTRGILKDYPDIGEVIEKFVTDRNIGADALRRTGVLTFDGNARVGKKVTFSRIQEHLESTYQRKFPMVLLLNFVLPEINVESQQSDTVVLHVLHAEEQGKDFSSGIILMPTGLLLCTADSTRFSTRMDAT